MKLLIAGGRDFHNQSLFNASMRVFVGTFGMPEVIICGMCKTGADEKAVSWAKNYNVPVDEHPAKWTKHGRSAGPIRNKEMAPICDRALIFWDAKSRGTANMIEELKKADKPYQVVYYNP